MAGVALNSILQYDQCSAAKKKKILEGGQGGAALL
jgi:hypothetical protein